MDDGFDDAAAEVDASASDSSDTDVHNSDAASEEHEPEDDELAQAGFVLNLRSGIYHAMQTGEAKRLKRGRRCPGHCVPADYTAALAEDKLRCRRCFG